MIMAKMEVRGSKRPQFHLFIRDWRFGRVGNIGWQGSSMVILIRNWRAAKANRGYIVQTLV